MKALILNSGLGSRMGSETKQHPKCMTELRPGVTILSRQLHQLEGMDIDEIVITTGAHCEVLKEYCKELGIKQPIRFVHNAEYQTTNYIYSIYCAREYLQDDVILMHGDLVFDSEIVDAMVVGNESSMAVSYSQALPQRDFKAVIHEGKIEKVGIAYFDDAVAAQPLYYLKKADWLPWLDEISRFCENDERKVYAENALNAITESITLKPWDYGNRLCAEIDTVEDLAAVRPQLQRLENRKVYVCFSSDILHSGHISLIKKAARLGRVIIGVMSDEAVATYKRFPMVPYSERKVMFENISGVSEVVQQDTLSYRDNLLRYKPDIVVHGDDWATGFQKPVRDEVMEILSSYGGRLVEYSYAQGDTYERLEARQRLELAMPELRRGRIRKLLDMKGFVSVLEAHDGITGLVVENTVLYQNGAARQFDAMWVSSLCDSTAKGKPDIELVDMTSRFRTIEDIMEISTKPIIFDGDTGGRTEHFVYMVRTLERLGVSMVIIEDKKGLKKNSLFGTEVEQTQDSIEDFCTKIRAGKRAQKTKDFMICARIESLILEKGMEDALERAAAFVNAGADAIMIHSRKSDPQEIFEFLTRFRESDSVTPVVVVPTSYNSVTEEELKERGANIVIYANQLMRATVPAIQNVANSILEHHRSLECDEMLMPFKEIIRLIPEE